MPSASDSSRCSAVLATPLSSCSVAWSLGGGADATGADAAGADASGADAAGAVAAGAIAASEAGICCRTTLSTAVPSTSTVW